ncbi:MFS transporter [Actinomadura sp. KC216]|uniref:MFS transporter n=1 Tax=Actinomadura sp. KC216 TaxID=2530370 RepID=UPI00104BB088|nr:MFS transporter [Actinomadura sp. KC216]TDB91387.1 MFS transporter [Actinomadura sp. KC216]
MRSLLAGLGWWDALTSKGTIRLLAVQSLIDALGTGIALVVLPFFASRAAGLSAGEIALVLSAGGICEFAAAVPNGVIAGRIGVRKFIVLAHLVQGASYVVVALASGLPLILAGTMLAGLSRAGSGGLSQVLTANVLGEDQRSGALGSIRALRNIGYLLAGGTTSLILTIDSEMGMRVGLLLNTASFFLSAYWTIRLPATDPAEARPTTGRNWSVLRDYQYFGLICSASVFSSSLMVLSVGLPLWALHEDQVPNWTVSLVVTLNTALVIILQYRFSERLKTVRSSITGVRLSGWMFVATAVLIALTASRPLWLTVALLVGAALALTLGELLESPAFWTLSYELAPADHRSEYMSTFDLNRAGMSIAGPPAMAAVVALGVTGWLLYAAALLAAGYGGAWIASRRTTRFTVPAPAAEVPAQPG